MTKEKDMGNRYCMRSDLVGLTRAEKKQVWNREYWERKRGFTTASGEAASESFRYRRMIKPVGILGNPPDKIWWETNDASFKRGLQIALLKFKSNAG